MSRTGLTLAMLALCGLSGTWAWGDIESGPTIGARLSPLNVKLVENGTATESQDVVLAHLEHPTVYLLVNAARFDRPAAAYIRGIDTLVQELQRRDPLAGLVVVWLTDETTRGVERVAAIQRALRLPATHWSVSADGAIGSEGWGINDRAAVTAVLANGREVVARFGYDAVNETNAVDLKRAIDKLKPE